MVKKKNIQVRTKQPSTCRATTPVSQIAESEALDPLKESTHHRAPAAPLELQTTDEIPQGFPDRVYLLAAAIFQNNHLQKPAAHRLVNYGKQRGLPLPEVKDEEMRRAAYELAFNTLKYQDLLEDIMIDSCLHLPPSIPDDEMSLAAVVLYDLQDRKFMPRRHHQGQTEEIIAEARSIENYLTGCSTKLAASLARCRIKHNVLSIHCILPRSVRIKQGRSNCLPHYAWVNTMKSSLDEVQAVLKSSGFSQVKSAAHLEGQSFCRDPHCGDLLVFPAGLKPRLNSTNLLTDHKLTIQDKFCSLGPNLVCSVLPARGDVLMVGHFSGLTVAHTASLVAWKHTTQQNSNNQSTVYVCVSGTEARRQEIQQVVTTMGCKNVKLMPGVFQSLDRAEKTLQRVRVILLTPRCSMSAVSDPVQFILQENGGV
ncbi:putative methyltransferase NSUN7 [Cynoglossus semilaevis]|uniref:putative methyltransferase NSUN7 n=1 Tax=Cynoglossus semilaevis TaxID=244447 RepID=UPI0007DCAEF5|nr:putative methyltransferase NSUN7 [Cynoglossus semilaevis]XP_024918696.1 putative methyltransferase NSUN7 [Cynoglossus semilaevis]